MHAETAPPRLCTRRLRTPGCARGDCAPQAVPPETVPPGATALSGSGALPSSSKACNSRCQRCLLRRFHDGRSRSRGHVHRRVAGMWPEDPRCPQAEPPSAAQDPRWPLSRSGSRAPPATVAATVDTDVLTAVFLYQSVPDKTLVSFFFFKYGRKLTWII